MIYLFIHENFPGQYEHIVRHLAEQDGNTIYSIAHSNTVEMDGVHSFTYARQKYGPLNCHPLTVPLDSAIRNGVSVSEICRKLRDEQGVYPDLIVGHCGWGETLFVKDLFPDALVLTYFEFYYHPHGVDLDFDPEFASLFAEPDRLRVRNAVSLMAAESTDWGHTATQWQRSLLPPELRKRVTVIHEGVDTDLICPSAKATLKLPGSGLTLKKRDEVITYTARNLEPYRGFHTFMRAIPEILRRRPKAQIVIVGGDEVSYGSPAPPGTTYRELMLAEIGTSIDHSRVHFLPKLEYATYIRLLQVSSAHVYLTYPFILSWSFIEAMAAGCLVIGSATPPVLEVLDDGVNGLTVDFFSPEQIAERVDQVFAHPDRMQDLRNAARQTALDRYDLKRLQIPRWMALLDDLANGRRPALNP